MRLEVSDKVRLKTRKKLDRQVIEIEGQTYCYRRGVASRSLRIRLVVNCYQSTLSECGLQSDVASSPGLGSTSIPQGEPSSAEEESGIHLA